VIETDLLAVLGHAIVQHAITEAVAVLGMTVVKVEGVRLAAEDLIEEDLDLHCHQDVLLGVRVVLDVPVLRFLHHLLLLDWKTLWLLLDWVCCLLEELLPNQRLW
jgi:hypothetical protein